MRRRVSEKENPSVVMQSIQQNPALLPIYMKFFALSELLKLRFEARYYCAFCEEDVDPDTFDSERQICSRCAEDTYACDLCGEITIPFFIPSKDSDGGDKSTDISLKDNTYSLCATCMATLIFCHKCECWFPPSEIDETQGICFQCIEIDALDNEHDEFRSNYLPYYEEKYENEKREKFF